MARTSLEFVAREVMRHALDSFRFNWRRPIVLQAGNEHTLVRTDGTGGEPYVLTINEATLHLPNAWRLAFQQLCEELGFD